MKNALLWNLGDDSVVTCNLCAHRCRVASGKRGVCKVRVNDGGVLYTSTYGWLVAENIDPIEKKPLYHFLPSTETYSIALPGCNFCCDFCQNWSISQISEIPKLQETSPEKVVACALKYKCESISFTYTEPTVYFEYALDTAKLACDAGLKNIFVSNGYMTPECLQMVAPYLHACNIDLKSFRDDFYKKLCGASLAPVLENLKSIRAAGIWLEVTTLIVPGENDSEQELANIAGFIAKELGTDVPWHVSRFFPRYRMDNRSGYSPTEVSSVIRAAEIGHQAGLKYVYAGNIG